MNITFGILELRWVMEMFQKISNFFNQTLEKLNLYLLGLQITLVRSRENPVMS